MLCSLRPLWAGRPHEARTVTLVYGFSLCLLPVSYLNFNWTSGAGECVCIVKVLNAAAKAFRLAARYKACALTATPGGKYRS